MRLIPSILSLMLTAAPLAAHEFWISPQAYTIDVQDQLVADLRVGENFKGGASPYLPNRFVRFDLIHDNTIVPVAGRIGDRPALDNVAPGEGLVVIVHQTTNSFLTYRTMEKFENFVRHKDFAWALDAHTDRGLPDSGFREIYSRHGKSLIAVGDGAGADTEVGLVVEILALANPYTDDLSAGMPVRVLYGGAPRGNAQVELFAKGPDETVSVSLHRTDDAGEVFIPVEPGFEYLVDSVVMRPVSSTQDTDPVWESLWASLTFTVPAD